MATVAALAALAVVIGGAVFLAWRDAHREAQQLREARHRWAAEIRDRRFRRYEQTAAPGPGMFRCSSCGETKPIRDQVEMGEVLRAIQLRLKHDAPIPLICDDCYTVIMGDGPVFIDKGT